MRPVLLKDFCPLSLVNSDVLGVAEYEKEKASTNVAHIVTMALSNKEVKIETCCASKTEKTRLQNVQR